MVENDVKPMYLLCNNLRKSSMSHFDPILAFCATIFKCRFILK